MATASLTPLPTLKVDPVIRDWIPSLRRDELQLLEESLVREGCRDAIVAWNGTIVDGHHRYAICHRILTPFQVREINFPDIHHVEVWVRSNQIGRRNLTDDQRAANADLLAEAASRVAKRERAQTAVDTRERKAGRSPILSAPVADKMSKRDVRQEVAKAAGVSEKRVRRMRAIRTKDPALAQQILQGSTDIKKAERQIRAGERETLRAQAASDAKESVADSDHGVKFESFIDVASSLEGNSVDLIFTDPPYHDKTLPIYSDLGIAAARVLKDGGSLITYTSHHRIPEVIEMLHAAGLTFFWPIAMVHNSPPYARMTEYGIVVRWKPLLWFVKGKFRSRTDMRFVEDLVESGKEKGFHPWQQSVVEARYYIEALTQPGDLVFDPFCGGGTTAVAAVKAQRRWLTCDVDESSVFIARKRIADARSEAAA